jgi:hypothetical protein
LNSLNFSGFNPPPSYRRIKEDFFYLYVRTIEGNDFHITANPIGFYVNNSNMKSFNPDAAPGTSTYTCLLDLWKNVSPIFKKNFEVVLKAEPLNDYYDLP